jgi:hypothetical protein
MSKKRDQRRVRKGLESLCQSITARLVRSLVWCDEEGARALLKLLVRVYTNLGIPIRVFGETQTAINPKKLRRPWVEIAGPRSRTCPVTHVAKRGKNCPTSRTGGRR